MTPADAFLRTLEEPATPQTWKVKPMSERPWDLHCVDTVRCLLGLEPLYAASNYITGRMARKPGASSGRRPRAK